MHTCITDIAIYRLSPIYIYIYSKFLLTWRLFSQFYTANEGFNPYIAFSSLLSTQMHNWILFVWEINMMKLFLKQENDLCKEMKSYMNALFYFRSSLPCLLNKKHIFSKSLVILIHCRKTSIILFHIFRHCVVRCPILNFRLKSTFVHWCLFAGRMFCRYWIPIDDISFSGNHSAIICSFSYSSSAAFPASVQISKTFRTCYHASWIACGNESTCFFVFLWNRR